MRIAIPIYGEYISPRFDCAGTMLVVEKGDSGAITSVEHPLSDIPHNDRPAFLSKIGVSVLLCGGIRRCDQFVLEGSGIVVVAGLMGLWKTILDEYLADRITHETTLRDRGSYYGRGHPQRIGCRRRNRGNRLTQK